MRKLTVALILAIGFSAPSFAAGLLKPKDGSLPELQLKDHVVDVVINNGFAVTEVDQVFHNPHERDLEAVYTFPLPKDASLSELTLWIDGQEVVGEVVEKEEARRAYREEKAAGRDTALAEKRDYFAFDVLVSPVRAGSDTRVRIVYLQPLEIDASVGRYVYPLAEGGVDEESQAFWERQPLVHGRFAFQCMIRTAYPVDDVRAKGFEHLSRVTQSAPDTWLVNIDGGEGGVSLDQDVVVYYSLAKNLPARVDLLAHRRGDEPGTFMVVVTPGADLQPITEGVDWSVVLDVSGSMQNKIAQAAEGVSRALDQLRPHDRFRIIVFSDTAREVTSGWQPVTPGAVEAARRRMEGMQVQGGTNLYAGVQSGLSGLEADRTSALLLVSDAGANIGPTEHTAFVKLLEKRDVRVFAFVMGQGANQPLMERMAKSSGGFTMDVSNQDDLYGRILQAKARLSREALHGVRLEMDGVAVEDLTPARLPAAYAGQQITLFGRYPSPGEATLSLRARVSGEEKTWQTRITLPESDDTYPELERLWALSRVKDVMERIHDGGGEGQLRKQVVDLGTTYSIVTDYTSMVVMSEEQLEKRGVDRKNRQRTGEERAARVARHGQYAKDTRADTAQPMFGGQQAHYVGGGGGAMGPEVVGLLGALLGARALLRGRRKGRSGETGSGS